MGLQENFRNERVDQLTIRDPVTVGADASVRDAVTLMQKKNLGCAIVIDGNRKPIGIFTESMLTEMLSHDADGINDSIKKHMAERFPWVKTTDPIADVLEAMQINNTRLLCVVDEKGRVAGLTGQRGLMEYVAEHFPGEVMVQRIGQPSYLSDREGA